jgi:type I restriction enzyme S subunit
MIHSDWPVVEVKDVCELIVDCINSTAPTVDELTPYKMVKTTNIENGRLNLSDVNYVTEETYEKWTRRAEVNKGDVLITREGSMGEVAYVDCDDTIFLGRRIVQYRADENELDPRYLSYALLSPYVQGQVDMFRGSGSTIDRISIPDCESFKIPLPPLDYQKKISKVLGTIDEKIDKNRQMNRTLGELARSIFESRFIEFSEHDEFKQSDKGELPSDFKVGGLPELMDIVLGGTPTSDVEEYYGGEIIWAKAKDVSQETDVVISSTEKTITKKGLDKSSAEIIPKGTTIITARGTVGETALAPRDMTTNQTCYGLVPNDPNECYFLYFTVRTHIDQLRSRTHGTVFDTINMATLREQEVVLPPKSERIDFNQTVEPLIELMINNQKENKTLEELRDTLLPKFISGDIRASDISVGGKEVQGET